jgi:hypothetical protein
MIQVGDEEDEEQSDPEDDNSEDKEDSGLLNGPKAIIAGKSVEVEGAKKIVQNESEHENEEEDECEQLSANGSADED